MENINVNANVNTENTVETALPTITETTTLGELLEAIGTVTKADKIPSPKKLRENAGDPIAQVEGCLVYANGYAVYDNGSGRTVLWLPDCVSFTYHFNPLRDSEKGGEIDEKCELPEGMLESQPWVIPVTLIGEHRIEALTHHRKSDRTETKSFIRGDNEEGDAMEDEEEREDSLRKRYSWRDGQFGENPEDAYIRKEEQEEAIAAMTEKQREVFIPYFKEGYTQQEIADKLGISKQSVNERLEGAIRKVKKHI